MVGLPLYMVKKNMGNLKAQRRHSLSWSESPEPSHSAIEAPKKKIIPLHKYLSTSIEEYNEFSEFLASCFALENLLFFVKAIRLRRIISDIVDPNKYKSGAVNTPSTNDAEDKTEMKLELGIDTTSSNVSDNPAKHLNVNSNSTEIDINSEKYHTRMNKVFAMEFEYLEEILDREKLKDNKSIHGIAVKIYHKYISSEGEYQLNISADIRQNITDFFNSDHEMNDYLHLYDDVLREVYNALSNVYRYKFRADSRYVK